MYGNILSGTGDPLFSVKKTNPNHDAKGRFTSKDKSAGALPAAPGSTPLKAGHVRLYHQTDGDNLRSIEKDGLLLEKAKGIEGPRAIYAGETPFYGDAESRPTLEFQVPKDQWDSPFVLRDVTPADFISAHYPWHRHARYLEDNPESLKNALEGKYDNLDGDTAKAVAYVKQKYGVAKKMYSAVLKANPYHDDQGRFTSKEKAKYRYLQAMNTMEQILTDMSMSGLQKPDKKMVDQALGQFAKYLGHASDANDVIINVEHFINNLAGSHADKQAILNQVKAIQAGQKAWTKIYKAKAEKFLDEQVPQLWADLATLPSGPGATKQALYIKKKLDHHEQMFLANGGTKEEWDKLVQDAANKSDSISSGFKPAPQTAIPVPPKPSAQSYEPYQGNPIAFSPPVDVEDAKKSNHGLGINYYHKRDLYGQDHEFTQLAYAEWQKSKDWLKANDSSFDSSAASAQSKSAYGNSELSLPKPVKAGSTTGATLSSSGTTPSYALSQVVIKASFKVAHIKENLSSYSSQDLAKANLELNQAKSMAKSNGITGATLAGLVNKGTNKYKKEGASYFSKTGPKPPVNNALLTGKLNAAVPAGGYPKILGDSGKLTEHFNSTDPKYFHNSNEHGPAGYLSHQFAQRAALSFNERLTILGYSGSDYTKVNHAATKGTPDTHSGAQAVKFIEAGLAKTTLGADMSLRRNGAQKWFFKAMGVDLGNMDHLNDDDLQKLVGRSYTETAFSSTSRDPSFAAGYSNTAQESGGIIYRIRAHKDIRGIDLRKESGQELLSSHSSEKEVLLDKNLVYRVTGIKRISTATTGFTPRYEVFVDAIGHEP